MWIDDKALNTSLEKSQDPVLSNHIFDDRAKVSARRGSQRIQHATRLNLFEKTSSEAYQVVNYGLGGQYNIHPDSFGFHLDQPPRINPVEQAFNEATGDRQVFCF